MRSSSFKVVATGLRGVPHIQGGIETHAAELYPRLAKLGADITVVGRHRFRPPGIGRHWCGIRLHWLWAPQRRGLEAAVHTILAVLYAGIRRPDVLHIHAVGPSITVPLAKLLGLRVVVTHHGQDHLREKWGRLERTFIHMGEKCAMRFSDGVITISSSVQALLRAEYGREAAWIPNGVGDPLTTNGAAQLQKYGLEAGHYVIQVSRLVPEKRQLDLIKAFRQAQLPGWKLVLVGGSQGVEPYATSVLQSAAECESIVCTGALPAPEVQGLLSQAGIFVLPSSHEGLPIALLEALVHGVPALASDIPGNREIGLNADSYFAVGDTEALAARLRILANSGESRTAIVGNYPEICSRFDWDRIAVQTIAVLHAAARGRYPPARADSDGQPLWHPRTGAAK